MRRTPCRANIRPHKYDNLMASHVPKIHAQHLIMDLPGAAFNHEARSSSGGQQQKPYHSRLRRCCQPTHFTLSPSLRRKKRQNANLILTKVGCQIRADRAQKFALIVHQKQSGRVTMKSAKRWEWVPIKACHPYYDASQQSRAHWNTVLFWGKPRKNFK